MNAGIYGLTSQEALGPYPLLGSPRPIPTIDARAYDADAGRYIEAVEAADGSRLEPAVASAINAFVIGCKADSIWQAIRACCIFMGARTLAGALTPLAGSAPTNVNFVSGDYNRRTGLAGNAASKHLILNRTANQEPRDSAHHSIFITNAGATNVLRELIATGPGNDRFFAFSANAEVWPASRGSYTSILNVGTRTGFWGVTRNANNLFECRIGGVVTRQRGDNNASATSAAWNMFARIETVGGQPNFFTSMRCAFFSIGTDVHLAALEQRVTQLQSDIAMAI